MHIFIAIELLALRVILDGTQNYEVQWNCYVECNIVIFFEKSLNTIQNFKRDVVYCWAQKYQSKGTLAKGNALSCFNLAHGTFAAATSI